METVSVGLGFHQIVLWAGERIETSETSNWNVWNIGLKSQYRIEMARIETSGDAARATGTSVHFGPLPSVLPLCWLPAIKSADWPDHACQYQYWWILIAVCGSRQKLLKSCGGTFQTCRYKIICICSCLVNFHCLTQILTMKLMQQMGCDAKRWGVLTCLSAKFCTCPDDRLKLDSLNPDNLFWASRVTHHRAALISSGMTLLRELEVMQRSETSLSHRKCQLSATWAGDQKRGFQVSLDSINDTHLKPQI